MLPVSRLIIALYSSQQRVWKIADFGLATEGTSKHHHTTRYARGTSSYRAPELVNNGKFTNKVDIWALGCILFEVIFLQKAFLGDYAVQDYSHKFRASGEKLQFPLDLAICQEETFRKSIESLIHKMLEVDASLRPSAVDLLGILDVAFGQRSSEITTDEVLRDGELPSIWL